LKLFSISTTKLVQIFSKKKSTFFKILFLPLLARLYKAALLPATQTHSAFQSFFCEYQRMVSESNRAFSETQKAREN